MAIRELGDDLVHRPAARLPAGLDDREPERVDAKHGRGRHVQQVRVRIRPDHVAVPGVELEAVVRRVHRDLRACQ
jgi:hypothetical protein